MAKRSRPRLCGGVPHRGEAGPPAAPCGADRRKVGAGGPMSLMTAPSAGVTFSGPISPYDITVASGSKATQNFRRASGSQMYDTDENMEGVTVIAASTLDEPERFTPTTPVYASRALSWDRPAATTQQFAETPPRG